MLTVHLRTTGNRSRPMESLGREGNHAGPQCSFTQFHGWAKDETPRTAVASKNSRFHVGRLHSMGRPEWLAIPASPFQGCKTVFQVPKTVIS